MIELRWNVPTLFFWGRDSLSKSSLLRHQRHRSYTSAVKCWIYRLVIAYYFLGCVPIWLEFIANFSLIVLHEIIFLWKLIQRTLCFGLNFFAMNFLKVTVWRNGVFDDRVRELPLFNVIKSFPNFFKSRTNLSWVSCTVQNWTFSVRLGQRWGSHCLGRIRSRFADEKGTSWLTYHYLSILFLHFWLGHLLAYQIVVGDCRLSLDLYGF